MYLDILAQYIVVLLQYACHISQYIAIHLWHIVTALPNIVFILFGTAYIWPIRNRSIGEEISFSCSENTHHHEAIVLVYIWSSGIDFFSCSVYIRHRVATYDQYRG